MAKQTVTLKEYLKKILYLLDNESPIVAYIYCITRHLRDEYILVNIDEIPEELTIKDIEDIIEGKFIMI